MMRTERVARSRPVLEDFEPRILHSADSPAAIAAALLAEPAAVQSRQVDSGAAATAGGTEVVFIDSSVANAAQMQADIAAQAAAGRPIEAFLLDANQDGVAQMTTVIAAHSDISAVHVISHGAAGEITLGNTTLDNTSLLQYAGAIASWRSHLGTDADLLIYGCDVGAGPNGSALLQGLAQLSGTTAAASNDDTGNTALGGDWTLEVQTGRIDAASALDAAGQAQWMGLLANDTAPILGSGGSGTVQTAVSASGASYAYASAVQGDGKLLVAGAANVGGTLEFSLIRYNVDGSLDSSFGGGTGKVLKAVGTGHAQANSLAIQADGKIVLGGSASNGSNTDFALLRFNSDGSLDTGFGSGGTVLTDFGAGDDSIARVLVQGDGQIVAAGTVTVTSNINFGAARYNSDGTLDTSYGGGSGKVSTDIVANSQDYATGAVLQSNGSLVVAGYSNNFGQYDFSAIRYTTAGVLDTTFGSAGKTLVDFGGSNFDIGRSIAVQSDDRLVIAGETFSNGYQFAVARLTAAGLLDTSFNGTGKVTSDLGAGDDHGYAVALQGDGRIVVVGSANNGAQSLATVRYLANGALDTSFGGTGIVTTKFSNAFNDEVATTVAITTGGTIYTIGNGTPTAGGFPVLMSASYTPSGTSNAIYGGIGSLATTIAFTENGSAVVMAPNVVAYDNELAMQGHYAGATLTLLRHGGASAQDVFSATGSLNALTQGAGLVYAGTTIGTVTTNSAGTLVLTFNASATQSLVNSVLQSLAYSNNSDAPPASLQIDWTLDDGNTGNAQGPGGAMSGSGTTTVSVTRLNDAPTFSNGSTAALTQIGEDQVTNGGQTVASFVTNISDPDGAGVAQGIAITVASATVGTWQYSIDNGSSWQAVGTPSTTSALLLRSTDLLRIKPDGNNGGSGNLVYRAWDQTSGSAGTSVDTSSNGGATAFSSATANATITIIAVNDAPALSGSSVAFPTINEDAASSAAQLVSALVGTITDVDAGALKGIAITAANAGHGTWQIQTNGSSWVNLDSVNISGTNAMLLASTDKIRFVPDGRNADAAALTYRAWDQTSGTHGTPADASGFGGTSAFSTTTLNVGISVTAVNDAPSLTPIHPALTGIDEDANPNPGQSIASFIGSSITDVDTGAITGIAITSATTTGTGKWQYSINGGTSWLDLGSVQTTAARLLLASDWIRYLPDSQNGGTSTLGYVAWDTTSGTRGSTASTTTNGGTTAFSNTADSATLAVASLNDAPTLSGANAMAPIAENPSSNPGTLVQSLIAGKYGDVDSVSTAGIAVTAVDNGNGSWQYTTDGGTNWFAFGSVSTGAAWLLAADGSTRIRFVPAFNYSGSVTNGLSFRAWDQSSGSANSAADTSANGGSSAFSLAIRSTSITVSATPTPIGTSNTLTIDEDTVRVLKASDFGFGSPNGLTLKAVIVDPATAGTLALNNAAVTAGQSISVADIDLGLLTFTPDPNANGSPYASLLFQVQDSANIVDPTSRTFGFNVAPVNDAPQLIASVPDLPTLTEKDTSPPGNSVDALFGSAITDADGAGVAKGVAITAASNGGNGDWQYSLDGGTNWHVINAVAPDSALLLRGSDLLRFVPDGTNGTVASLSFAAWDQTSGSAGSTADSTLNGDATAFSTTTGQLGITVTSVNDPPAITSNGGGPTAAISLPENQSAVTTVTATDPDLPADTLSFSIAPVDDGALFSINASGELSFDTAPDYDAPQNASNIYLVTVQVSDGQGGVTSQALTVTVTPVNDNAPILSVAPAAAFTEDGPAVALSPAASVSDVELNYLGNDAGVTLTLQRHGGASADDVFSAGAGIASLSEGAALVVSGTTIGSVVTNSAGTLVLSFNGNATQALVNSALQGIAYANSNHNPPGTVELDWIASDGNAGGVQGTGPALTGTAGTLVTITAMNDAPALAVAAPVLPSINEDALGNGGIPVSTLLAGSVTDDDIPSLSGIAIDGQNVPAGTGTWQFSIDGGSSWSDFGSVGVSTSLLLRATDQLRFVPDGKNGTAASFSYRAWDQTGGGLFGTRVDTGTHGGSSAFSDGRNTASITVDPLNDAPQLTPQIPGATLNAITEDQTTDGGQAVSSFLGSSISDVDSLSLQGIAIVATTSGTGAWEYSTDNGANWVAVDPVSGTSSLLLRASDKLRFLPDGDNGTTASITYRAWDQTGSAVAGTRVDTSTNGGVTAFSIDTDSASITVGSLNDAPVLTPQVPAVTWPQITEDQTSAVRSVAQIVGTSIGDVDSISLQGIAIVAATSINGAWQYSLDNGGHWLAVDAVSGTSALLLRSTDLLRFVANGIDGGNSGITYRAWDQSGGSVGSKVDTSTNGGTSAFSIATDSATITVTAIDDAPSFLDGGTSTLGNTVAFTENGAPVVLASGAQVSDPELKAADNYAGASLTLGRSGGANAQDVFSASGALAALAEGGSLVYGGATIGSVTTNGNGTLVLSFGAGSTQALVNAALQHIAYANSSEVPPASVTIAWIFNDGNTGAQGSGGASSTGDFTRVDIAALNDAPLLAGGADATTSTRHGPPLVLAPQMTVSDAELDAVGSYAGATLDLSRHGGADAQDAFSASGLLGALGEGGALVYNGTTIGSVTTNSGGRLTLTFNASATSALVTGTLQALAYSNSSNTPSPTVPIDWRFSDGNTGAQGSGGALTSTSSTTVHITSVNDAPLLTPAAPSLAAITEDQTANAGQTVASLLGSSIGDGDAGALQGIAITATSSLDGSWQYSLDGGATWAEIGSPSDGSALLLRASDWLRFAPDGRNGGSDAIGYRAWDQSSGSAGSRDDTRSNGGITAFSSASDTATIAVASINDAPVLAAATPSLAPVAVNDDGNAGQTVQSLLGTAIGDVDAGALQGIAITGATGAMGEWQVAIGNGAWIALGAVGDSAALLLRAGDRIRFVPDGDAVGTASIRYRAWDQSEGGAGSTADVRAAGGTRAFSVDSNSASLAITPVYTSPVITSAAGATIASNSTAVMTVTASDASLPALPLRFSIAGGADAAQFRIDAQTGALSFIHAPGGAGNFQVTVTASNGVLATSQAMLIHVTSTAGNTAPRIVSPGDSVILLRNDSGLVATIIGSDDDRPAQTLRYFIAGGEDAALFTIDAASGSLRFIDPPGGDPIRAVSDIHLYKVIVGVSDGELQQTEALEILLHSLSLAPPDPIDPTPTTPAGDELPRSRPQEGYVQRMPAIDTRLAAGRPAALEALASDGTRLAISVSIKLAPMRLGSTHLHAPDIASAEEENERLAMLMYQLLPQVHFSAAAVGHARPIVVPPPEPAAAPASAAFTPALIGGLAIGAALVGWAGRGSALLTSLLISAPAWRSFDLLPVLRQAGTTRTKDATHAESIAGFDEPTRPQPLSGLDRRTLDPAALEEI